MHGVGDEPALQTRGLDVSYGWVVAARDVSLAVDPGELVALVGPNGAGKSSVLHAILGHVAHSGDVVLHGRSCGRRHRTDVAFVPQRQAVELDFPITVAQVVACGRRPFVRFARRPGREDRQAIAQALSRVGLDGLEHRPIGELSGGQAQRVFIARAIAQQADVLLLDEPLTGVDAPTARSLLELFCVLCDSGAAIVVTTHDLGLVRERFGRCVALNQTVVGDGDPRDVLGPAGLERMLAHA